MHRNPENLPSVLIVEDELVLRMRAVNIVEDAGFNPVEAVDADEALSILEARSDISALFTDIQMPGSIDGLKLAHAVHERWPSIRIILVSGRIAPLEADRPADSRFFGKPVPDATMIAQLQEMLGTESLKVLRPSLPVVAEYAPAHDTLLTENASLKLLVEQARQDHQHCRGRDRCRRSCRGAAGQQSEGAEGGKHPACRLRQSGISGPARNAVETFRPRFPSLRHLHRTGRRQGVDVPRRPQGRAIGGTLTTGRQHR